MNIDKNISKKMQLIDKAKDKLKANNRLSEFITKWGIPKTIGEFETWKLELQKKSLTDFLNYQKGLLSLALSAGWPREELENIEDNLIMGIYVFKPRKINAALLTNDDTNEKELYLQIYGNTTKDDLRDPELWKLIKFYRKKLVGTKRNYLDKHYALRQKYFELGQDYKNKEIDKIISEKLEKAMVNEPAKEKEINQLWNNVDPIRISKDKYKQKIILGIKDK